MDHVFSLDLGSGFDRIWCQLRSSMEVKTFPKSDQVGSKIAQKLTRRQGSMLSLIFDRSDNVVESILLQSWNAEKPRSIEKPMIP